MFSPFSVSECLCLQGTCTAAPLVSTKWEKSLRPASADQVLAYLRHLVQCLEVSEEITLELVMTQQKGPKKAKCPSDRTPRGHTSPRMCCAVIPLHSSQSPTLQRSNSQMHLSCTVCLKLRLTLPTLQLLITGNPNTTRRKYVTERKS